MLVLINLSEINRSELEMYSNELSEKSLSTTTLWIEKISRAPFCSMKLLRPAPLLLENTEAGALMKSSNRLGERRGGKECRYRWAQEH